MDFLTPEERAQMEALMAKAAERRRKKGELDFSRELHPFFFHYQFKIEHQTERKSHEQQATFEQDITALLSHVCFFCQKYGIPACNNTDFRNGEFKRDNDISDLPF